MASNGTRFLGNRPINVKKVRKKSETEEELLNTEDLVRKISENEDDLFPSCIFDDSIKSGNSGYLSSTPTKTHETSQSRLANPNNSTLSDEEKRLLSSWGLPDTGKSLSEALLFAEHGENTLCTKIVLNVRSNFCTQHVLPRFKLGIFMY